MEKILDTDGQAGTILHGPHRHQDTGHERGAIQRVVADGEGLALRSEEHLLMGHQAAQPHPVHMDTVDVGSASSGSCCAVASGTGPNPASARAWAIWAAVVRAVPEGASTLLG